MPKTPEEKAEKIIDRINEKAKKIFIQSIELSISFGYKTKHKETEDIQDIYRSAEDLMYREKLLEIPSMRSGAIETILSYFENKKRGAISVAVGLALLALGEFLGWYSFVFPESILYSVSMIIKIGGLIALFIPVSKIPLTKIKFDDNLD